MVENQRQRSQWHRSYLIRLTLEVKSEDDTLTILI